MPKILTFLVLCFTLLSYSASISAQDTDKPDRAKNRAALPPLFEKTWFGDDSQLLCQTCMRNGRSLVIDPEHASGFMPYGPYEVLPKGKYKVDFYFNYIRPKESAKDDLLLEMDVGTWDEVESKFRSQTFLYGRDLLTDTKGEEPEKRKFTLTFNVTDETMVMRWEFRVFSYAKASYSLEKIVLKETR